MSTANTCMAHGEGWKGSAHLCAWQGWTMSVMSPSGPIMHRVDVTTFSRSGSSGGFVTCQRMDTISLFSLWDLRWTRLSFFVFGAWESYSDRVLSLLCWRATKQWEPCSQREHAGKGAGSEAPAKRKNLVSRWQIITGASRALAGSNRIAQVLRKPVVSS